VLGIGWLATKTEEFEAMSAFVAALGLEPTRQEKGVASFQLSNGDVFEVFGPDEGGGGHPEDGPIAGLLVDDARSAHERFSSAGYEVSPFYEDEGFAWLYVRAPDGRFYELFSRAESS
jgi:catechol 2,3-dioxygenase-like lactoylglutathione lyase family enzyme